MTLLEKFEFFEVSDVGVEEPTVSHPERLVSTIGVDTIFKFIIVVAVGDTTSLSPSIFIRPPLRNVD